MSTEYRYFIAAGRSLEAVNDLVGARTAALGKRMDLVRDMKAEDGWGTDDCLSGFILNPEAEIPAGWRELRKSNDEQRIIVPARRTKEGKAAAKVLADKSLRMPGCRDFASRIGFDMIYGEPSPNGHGLMIYWPTFGRWGGKTIICIPVGNPKNERNAKWADFRPPDAVPLKASAYWILREKAEKKEKKEGCAA